MPIFVYKARDKSGKPVQGELVGVDSVAIQEAVANKGLFPISVKAKGIDNPFRALLAWRAKPKPQDLANLTRQLELMFAVGMPIDKALATLGRQIQHQGLREAINGVQRDVAGGMRLSRAFRRHPQYFNQLFTAMLEMGQAGGVLDKTLKEMATILQKEHHIQTKVKSATLYPKIVTGTLLVVSWAMLAFVFPPFKAFYAGHGADLPLPTKIMIALSDLVTTYWYIPVMSIIVFAVLWKRFKVTERGRYWLSVIAFRLPVFGKLNLLVANARFGHLISALYRAGLPLPQSLTVVADTMTNVCYAKEVRELRVGIEHGKSLSQSMENMQYFSPMVKETCAVGEQTGKLDIILDSTAVFYDGEIEDMLENLTTLIEPIMLFFLFGAVLMLALAVYLPIWNMSKVILH